ncbi:hypothetical protein ACOMHN_056646 [Nucella lapillus]
MGWVSVAWVSGAWVSVAWVCVAWVSVAWVSVAWVSVAWVSVALVSVAWVSVAWVSVAWVSVAWVSVAWGHLPSIREFPQQTDSMKIANTEETQSLSAALPEPRSELGVLRGDFSFGTLLRVLGVWCGGNIFLNGTPAMVLCEKFTEGEVGNDLA